ncbi:MAG: hypothetical protein RLY43_1155 [Bacteroidota bacterium]|jgi:hypothetical protein
MKDLDEDELIEILNKLRLSPVKFTHEKNSKVTGEWEYDMLCCKNGWSFVGWTEADNVVPRMDAPFVCMFEQEDGRQSWCHAKFVSLETFAMEFAEKESEKSEHS